MQQARGGEPQDAGAGADIEDALGPAALDLVYEGEEAAERGAVVAGAEGERRLDLDRQVVRLDPAAVVRAVDQDAAGAHGLQPLEGGADPVLLVDRREDRLVGGVAEDRADQLAHRLLVGFLGEVGLEVPGLAVLGLEGRDRGLGRVEHLADQVGHGAGRALARIETEHVGRAVGRQAFEHARANSIRAARRHRPVTPLRQEGAAAGPPVAPARCGTHATLALPLRKSRVSRRNRSTGSAFIAAPVARNRPSKDRAMRTRLREQVEPEVSAETAHLPARPAPARDAAPWRRAAPLTAEDTALPGRMLMLLSRLHRSELELKAQAEQADAAGRGA